MGQSFTLFQIAHGKIKGLSLFWHKEYWNARLFQNMHFHELFEYLCICAVTYWGTEGKAGYRCQLELGVTPRAFCCFSGRWLLSSFWFKHTPNCVASEPCILHGEPVQLIFRSKFRIYYLSLLDCSVFSFIRVAVSNDLHVHLSRFPVIQYFDSKLLLAS